MHWFGVLVWIVGRGGCLAIRRLGVSVLGSGCCEKERYEKEGMREDGGRRRG